MPTLSMDTELVAPLIAQATSFSCALGPAVEVGRGVAPRCHWIGYMDLLAVINY